MDTGPEEVERRRVRNRAFFDGASTDDKRGYSCFLRLQVDGSLVSRTAAMTMLNLSSSPLMLAHTLFFLSHQPVVDRHKGQFTLF